MGKHYLLLGANVTKPYRTVSHGEALPEESMVDRIGREWHELYNKMICKSMHIIFELERVDT